MRRLTNCLSVVLWFALLGVVSAQVQAPKATISVMTDRPNAVYAVGEKVRFIVTVEKGGQPVREGKVAYSLTIDGAKQIGRGTADLSADGAVIEGTLSEPGFLLCHVTKDGGTKQSLSSMAGAGIAPQKIPPSLPVPDDFDDFWREQKAKLAGVPLKPVLTPVPSPYKSPKPAECFDVQIPCVGHTQVSGYFARPKGAKAKSLPAILFVHGAGVRSSVLGAAAGAAHDGAIAMDINAHGIPNGKPDRFYEDLSRTTLNNYPSHGRESRETCYFLGMFLRLVQAIDFLASQPEWDGKILAVSGASQGGGQAIAAAGLDARVTFIATGVPAICDHSGWAIGRINGWPKIVPNDATGKPDPKILEVARYFDCMNLATRAKAEAIFSVGFVDVVCPPTSVYATYNNYGGKKQMVERTLMGHAQPPDVAKAFHEAMWEHIHRMQRAK
jgi:cephalosporin-C deacetylase